MAVQQVENTNHELMYKPARYTLMNTSHLLVMLHNGLHALITVRKEDVLTTNKQCVANVVSRVSCSTSNETNLDRLGR
jgi:hypothetical protein